MLSLKRSALGWILALPIIAASACNKPPAPQSASSPPVIDLVCPAEPDIAALLLIDPSGLSFDIATRAAGQACRDALHRVCEWHKERGAVVDCNSPPEAAQPR